MENNIKIQAVNDLIETGRTHPISIAIKNSELSSVRSYQVKDILEEQEKSILIRQYTEDETKKIKVSIANIINP